MVGVVVHFDEETVGAGGHRGARERQNFIAASGSVRGVHHDRQVAAALHRGDDAQVQRVAREIGEGAHAALAEDHVVIALGHQVFRGHQEFVERGGHAALQQHRLLRAARALQKRKILHVARADLDHVRVFFDQVERFVVDGFGDDAEAEFVADFGQDFQPGLAEALKTVRRSARLVSAAAKEAHARGFHVLRDFERLLARFDGARPGDHGDRCAAE